METPTYTNEFVSCTTGDICENIVIGFQRQEEQVDFYADHFYLQQAIQWDVLNNCSFYLFCIFGFLIIYVIIKWLFNLISSFSLGW